jgi:hypothetical protein
VAVIPERRGPEATTAPTIARATRAHLDALVHGNAAMAEESEGRALDRASLTPGGAAGFDDDRREIGRAHV